MNVFLNIVKKIPFARRVVRKARQLLHRLITRDYNFPTDTYHFTKADAKKIYSIVLSGKLHHNSGTEVSSLEKEFAVYHKQKGAFATSTGTSAIGLALKSIGIQPGDEVIMPAYTNIATAQVVLEKGAVPVFADIDDTFNIAPVSIKKNISARTKAIIPVHMFGNVCDMDVITALAKRYGIYVIEDCCQAIGASYKGKRVGTLGDAGCYSFNAKKAITAGQGGMLITSNTIILNRITHYIEEVRNLYISTTADIVSTGHMYEMTEMQAALARSILGQLDSLNLKRQKNYALFADLMDTSHIPIKRYRILPHSVPSYSRLAFMIDFKLIGITRDHFIKTIRAREIPMRTYYPQPIYTYTLFQKKRDLIINNAYPFSFNKRVAYRNIHLPFVELFCRQMVGMDFSPYLTHKHIVYLSRALHQSTSQLTMSI